MKVAARSVRKALVPSSRFRNPSPGNLQSIRLALHIGEYYSSCWVYIASGRHVYELQIPIDDSSVVEGKQGLLIPVQTQVMESSLLSRCPHRSEIQSIALSETENMDGLAYSVLPRDSGVGEGSWAGLCFSPSQWSMAAVARGFCKSIDVYDQDIHLRTAYVFCGDWKQREKAFSFRGDSNWLGFSKCSSKDILGGWCDSGNILVADVVSKDEEITDEEITSCSSPIFSPSIDFLQG